jgi:hypothetical protein
MAAFAGNNALRKVGLMAVLASLAMLFALPAHAADPVSLRVAMSGRHVIGGGDPDGAGGGRLLVYPDEGRLCYRFTTARIYYAWSVQLHRGARGSDGPVVFDFRWPGWDSRWSDCANVSSELLRELVDDPGSFYVDVHTCEHWFGAIRGQVTRSR